MTYAGMLTSLAPPVEAQPARTDGWVVLGIDDYRALRARAYPKLPGPLPPPVDATLTRVDYELRVSGDTVTGEARLTVDVLKQGWVSIQVPAGMLVRAARLAGRPTSLVDGTPPRVLISRAGRTVLALDVVIPVTTSGGLESMTLAPSTSALSSVALTVPRAGIDLTVAGGFVAEQAETPAENRWTVYGSPGRPLNFSWKRRIDDRRTSLPLRARARITELVALGEETSQLTASVRIDVTQGIAREVVLATPEGVTVNNVTGATVADWSQVPGSVTVTFVEPLTTATQVLIAAETRTPRDGLIAIPILRMPAAERETGGLAVDVTGAGEITDRQPRGLDPADPSDLGDIVAGRESPAMAAFGFTPLSGSAPRALSVTVSRYTPQPVLVANVEEARYEVLAAEDAKLLVRARYAVRNNQRAFLAIRLPSQSVLWSAVLAGRPIRPGLGSDGDYLLPLQKGRTGENAPTFAVEVVYLQRSSEWTAKGSARVDLPAVDLPVSRTGVLIHHSPRFRVEPQSGVFRPENDAGPWSAALRNPQLDVATAGAAPAPAAKSVAPEEVAAKAEGDGGESLIERFRKDMGRTAAGAVPVRILVPDIGPSFFVAAELTAEAQAPAIDLRYSRVSRF
jgi:hypothetical protein